MRRRAMKDLTVEEFDAWANRCARDERIARASDEEGGPRLSLVPVSDRDIAWPTDLLAPAAVPGGKADPRDPSVPAPAAPPPPPIAQADAETGTQPASLPFDGLPLEDSRKRLAGWSADRQRLFLAALAETGSVHLASDAARLTARSAYRLRTRSPAFTAAWDTAEQLAVGRLSALAFDRALHGRIEQVWEGGTLVAERRVPNDRLLMWLLARLDPRRFAMPWEQRKDDPADPQSEARQAFPAQLDALTDTVAD